MDWSLVLASQGIEVIIDRSADGAGWQLLVAEQDYDQAHEAILKYQIENRGWRWRQPILGADLRFDWRSLAWVGLLVLFFWLDTRYDLRGGGVMDGSLFIHGQWWRLFTAIWLHADPGHLASNATLGFVLLGLVMARYGTMLGLLTACLSGVGGNLLAALATSHSYRSLGASGAVMGCVGLLALPSLRPDRKGEQRFSPGGHKARQAARIAPLALRYVLTALFAGLMLFVLIALGPGTDILAHLGGFLSGLAVAGLLAVFSNLNQKPGIHLLSGIVFALLVIVPWWFALHH